ncbi:hypothetical protein LEMLEM_LOCUS23085, partial [Lemmus lemmus]
LELELSGLHLGGEKNPETFSLSGNGALVFSKSEGRGHEGVADWRCERRHIRKKMSVLNQQLTPEVSCGQINKSRSLGKSHLEVPKR